MIGQSATFGVTRLGVHPGTRRSGFQPALLESHDSLFLWGLDDDYDLVASAGRQLPEVAFGEHGHVEDHYSTAVGCRDLGFEFGVDGWVADGFQGLQAFGVFEYDGCERHTVDVAGVVEDAGTELPGDRGLGAAAWSNDGSPDRVDVDDDGSEFRHGGSHCGLARADSTGETHYEHTGSLTDCMPGALSGRVVG